LGTYVISQVFDEVTYARLEKGNCLTLRKALPVSASVKGET